MSLFNKFTNYLIAIVNSVLLVFNVSPVDTNAARIDLESKYQLVWEDNFNGPELDTTNWRQHNSEGVRKGGYWDMDMVSVENGNLVITTKYKNDGEHAGWYTGAISTQGKHEQTYGYYECRCKLPKGQGLWSAFWLTNPNVTKLTTGNARKGAEIDVFESPFWMLGGTNKNKVTSNIHYNGYDLQTRYHNVGIFQLNNDPYRNYNTYGLEWTEEKYTFYINGRKVATSKYGGVSQENEYVILSCEVDGVDGKPSYGWSGNIERNKERKNFETQFYVDYVRVYKAKSESSILSLLFGD